MSILLARRKCLFGETERRAEDEGTCKRKSLIEDSLSESSKVKGFDIAEWKEWKEINEDKDTSSLYITLMKMKMKIKIK